ncbi:UDP-GlcNAc--UDP-phosphate GlcNAc-1-phosphate transferase [Peijinzhouia sedimentorum]
MKYFFVIIVLFIIELVYFRIAKQYKIVDVPNSRSSHKGEIVRGGGIIFALSAICLEIYLGFPHPYFMAGLIIVSFISFVDDIHSLPNRVRLLVHFLAVALMFLDTTIIESHWWLLIIMAIVVTGFLNAFNFMDGINGITGAYGLITIISLTIINEFFIPFIPSELGVFVLLGLLVFNYFNFRVKARCFAGDVGSISLPFIIAFFILKLYFISQAPILILLLAVYGVDSVNTILKRVLIGENIFMPHRTHLYQILVHKKQFSHLQVSTIYAFVQLSINVLVVSLMDIPFNTQIVISISGLLFLTAIYWVLVRRL